MDRGRAVRRVVAALGAVLTVGAFVLPFADPAGATNPPGPHDSIGGIFSIAPTADSTATAQSIVVTGWASDPDSLLDNHTAFAVLDGTTTVAKVVTSIASPTVTTKYHTGPTPRFSLTFAVPTGVHSVCIVAANTNAGLSTLLKCFATPYPTTLTADQIAKHAPVGAYKTAAATATTMRVTGWTDDPDYQSRAVVVVLYVDSVSKATVTTTSWPTTTTAPAGAGTHSYFDITVPVTKGAHVGCLWVVNIGYAANSSLGCKTVDTRGPAGTDPVVQPAVNKQVVTIALRHLGNPYVWGAAGPSSFDCSGLVVYTYSKSGMTTLPRTSEQQFAAARSIPASRAVPGDLVFTFDTEGDVYHVGIYISPGKAFAAIDEAEGVNYQKIWDPAHTSYGSFTHT